MDPTVPVIVMGMLGGVVIAACLVRMQRRRSMAQADAFGPGGRQRDVIDIAAIRVAGAGGLGLVAVAVGVAVGVPQIGVLLGVSAMLGVAFAAVLILRRRHSGPMPSSGQHSGANATLSIDEPPAAQPDRTAPPAAKLRRAGA